MNIKNKSCFFKMPNLIFTSIESPLDNGRVILILPLIDVQHFPTETINQILIDSWTNLLYSKFLPRLIFKRRSHKFYTIYQRFLLQRYYVLILLALEVDLSLLSTYYLKCLVRLPFIIIEYQFVFKSQTLPRQKLRFQGVVPCKTTFHLYLQYYKIRSYLSFRSLHSHQQLLVLFSLKNVTIPKQTSAYVVFDKIYNQNFNNNMESQGMLSSNQLSQSKQHQDSEVAGFVFKAFEIVSNEQYHKIIYWAPNGLEFIIRDVIKFEQIVLPRYFRHNKMNSFVRQLNMYGFHKIKHNNFKSTFRHQFFQKDREDLLICIRRKPKFNEKENQDFSQEIKILEPPPKPVEKIPTVFKQEEPTMAHQKWENISQQFLATTKMINMSLVKVTLNELVDITNYIPEQNDEDCASIEDELQNQGQKAEQFFDFQDPACFFASKFDL